MHLYTIGSGTKIFLKIMKIKFLDLLYTSFTEEERARLRMDIMLPSKGTCVHVQIIMTQLFTSTISNIIMLSFIEDEVFQTHSVHR